MFGSKKRKEKQELQAQVQAIQAVVDFIDTTMSARPSTIDWISVREKRVQMLNDLPLNIQQDIKWEQTLFPIVYPYLDEEGTWCNPLKEWMLKQQKEFATVSDYIETLDDADFWGPLATGNGSRVYLPYMSYVNWERTWCRATSHELTNVLAKLNIQK